jgi:hypothetical protein
MSRPWVETDGGCHLLGIALYFASKIVKTEISKRNALSPSTTYDSLGLCNIMSAQIVRYRCQLREGPKIVFVKYSICESRYSVWSIETASFEQSKCLRSSKSTPRPILASSFGTYILVPSSLSVSHSHTLTPITFVLSDRKRAHPLSGDPRQFWMKFQLFWKDRYLISQHLHMLWNKFPSSVPKAEGALYLRLKKQSYLGSILHFVTNRMQCLAGLLDCNLDRPEYRK